MAKAFSSPIPSSDEFIVGKAHYEESTASFKDLAEVCANIRRKPVNYALRLLEEAAEGKRPILYRSHNKKLAHRKELGGKKGRYPKKAAKVVLTVLKNAVSNAVMFGANEEQLKVYHASANKKRIYYRLQPKGRRTRHDYELSRVEIIVAQPLSEEEKERVKKLKEEHKKRAMEIAAQKKAEMKEAMEAEKSKGANIVVEKPERAEKQEKAEKAKKAEKAEKTKKAEGTKDAEKAKEGATKPESESKGLEKKAEKKAEKKQEEKPEKPNA